MKNQILLRVYDISDGLAKTWSPVILGKRVEGVWHTGIELYGFEYFYGGGIVKMRPENVESTFGISPVRVHFMGQCDMPRLEFEKYLLSIMNMFRRDCYDIMTWNCNHFTDHVISFLTGKRVPEYIMDLPNEVCKSFMGKVILNFIKMIHGGSAPISSDDPMHPKQILAQQNGSGTARSRTRSCPASPSNHSNYQSSDRVNFSRSRSRQNEAPKKPSFYGIESGELESESGRSVTSSKEKLNRQWSSKSEKRTQRGVSFHDTQVEVIRGAPLADEVQCEIVISPKHRRQYESDKRVLASQVRRNHRSRTLPNNQAENYAQIELLTERARIESTKLKTVKDFSAAPARKDRRSKTLQTAPSFACHVV